MPRRTKNRAGSTAIRQIVAVVFYLFGILPLWGQPYSLDVSQYLHASWTAQDGYFRGGVFSVSQASDGNLWLTSITGLMRFDGLRFVEWNPPATDSLPGKPLKSILGSKDGSLWIGGVGLAEITASGKVRRYHQLDKLHIERLAEDRDGGIWAGGSPVHGSPPLCRVYRGKVDCYGDNRSIQSITDLYVDEQGRLWAGAGDGVWRVQPSPPQKVASQDFVVALTTDITGALLFSSGPGIKTLSHDWKVGTGPILVEGKPIDVSTMFKDREGGLWIGTRGQGLVHVHAGRVDRFTTLDGLSSDFIATIFQDRESSVWVLSGGGLDRFTKPAVPRITRKQGLSNNEVLAVLADRNGGAWIGTSSGLDQLIGDRVIESKAKLPDPSAASMFQTAAGRLLVTTNTDDGIVWLDRGKSTPLKAKSGSSTFEITQDDHGDLWMVNRESGLLHLHTNGDPVETIGWKELKMGSYSVAFDPKRQGLWLGSPNGQLALVKDGKIVERYGPADGLGDDVLRDIQVDLDGAVWVSTQVGLARLMNGKIATLGTKNGLPCDIVHWMRRDDDHNVWLYTECGLVSFSESDLSAWIAQPSFRVRVRNYLDNTEGVECLSYNGWYSPQATKTTDGRILFAMTTGLGVLDPRNLDQNTLPPPVQIDDILADGKQIRRSDNMFLPKRVRNVHFTYTALSFVAPRKVLFRYKLEGYDSNWSEPVSRREVTYTNLPPRDYKFHVIACNNDGVWNETGAVLSFTIPPAFTQRASFKVLCLLGVVALVYLIYRLRVRHVTEQLRARMYERLAERERIARDLHDTFFQGIQGLLLRFHTATSQLDKEQPVRTIFEETLRQSDKVMLEGRELVFNLRAAATTQNDLRLVFADCGVRMGQSGSCTFKVVVNGAVYPLHPVVFEEIAKIGNEALSNAFRHSGAKSIETELNFESSELRICIRDDGMGIEDDILQRGYRYGHLGLPGMRERAQKIGAHLDLWTRPGVGTEIELRISAAFAYASRSDRVISRLRRLWRNNQKEANSA